MGIGISCNFVKVSNRAYDIVHFCEHIVQHCDNITQNFEIIMHFCEYIMQYCELIEQAPEYHADLW